jgi:hypothetical protein
MHKARGEGDRSRARTMDGHGKPLRRHSRGDGLSSPGVGSEHGTIVYLSHSPTQSLKKYLTMTLRHPLYYRRKGYIERTMRLCRRDILYDE